VKENTACKCPQTEVCPTEQIFCGDTQYCSFGIDWSSKINHLFFLLLFIFCTTEELLDKKVAAPA
jgi:hypothetical protein